MFFPILQTLVRNVTAKKRSQELEAPSKYLNFLHHVGFFKRLKASYPMADIYEDAANQKLYLEGRGDDFNSAYNEYWRALHEIAEGSFQLSSNEDTRLWDLIAQDRAQEYVNGILTSRNIQAKVCFSFIRLLFNIS